MVQLKIHNSEIYSRNNMISFVLQSCKYVNELGKETRDMMTIEGTGKSQNMQAKQKGMNMGEDSVSKNIQNQIANAQKKLQELSSNQDMTIEQKMKKRQEIQKEINNLNQQLRQHQIEQRKEQQSKNTSMDDMLGGSKKENVTKTEDESIHLMQTNMKTMITADMSMKKVQVHGSIASQMEDKASVLKSEIKLDGGRKANTEQKEKELANIQQKAQTAAASQMSAITDINKTIKESTKEEKVTGENNKTVEEGKEEVRTGNGTEAITEGNTSIDILL